MKKLYIPKGSTVHYETLETDTIIVKGCLFVDSAIRAKNIIGKGIIVAGSVSSNVIIASEIESGNVVAKKIAAERVYAAEIHASDSILASCYLESEYVQTTKLIVASSQIAKLSADDVINLAAERKGLILSLLASSLRSFWNALFGERPPKEIKTPLDNGKSLTAKDNATESDFEDTVFDDEFRRITALIERLKKEGYINEPALKDTPTFVFSTEAESPEASMRKVA